MPQNQHYISKCLTKPWESNGKLHYFDFETQKFESETSRKLFAQMDLWSPKLEEVFHKRFEKQLKGEILNFMRNSRVKSGAIPYRHILLMHFFNAMRGMKARYGIPTIEQFAGLSNKQLDLEMGAFLGNNLIVRIPINPEYRLFFSEDGFFSIPLTMKGSREMDLGLAVPLSTSMAFGIFPEDYNLDDLMDIVNEVDTYILKLSVGIAARRLVVHPDLIKNEPNLKEKILLARSTNIKAAQVARRSSKALQDRIDRALQNLKTSRPS